MPRDPRWSFCSLATLVALSASCSHMVPPRARDVSFAGGGGRQGPISQTELQQDLQRLTGVMTQRLTQAAEPLLQRATPEQTEQVLRRVLLYQASALDIVSGHAPEVNLLDMLVFVTLTRSTFETHWLPRVFGESSRPLLDALAASERDAWAIGDKVLTTAQLGQVHAYIRSWRNDNPDQVLVEAVRLSDFSAVAGQSARGNSARGLLASVHVATQTADEALLLGERALFLGQRVPFLLRSQVRLGAMEVIHDGLGQLDRADQLLTRSERLVARTNELVARTSELRTTLEDAAALTAQTETVVNEARLLLDTLEPLAASLMPLLAVRSPEHPEPPTRLELLAESSRKTTYNTLMIMRELRAVAPANPEEWARANQALDATVRRWLTYAALVGVLWIGALWGGYFFVKQRLTKRAEASRGRG